MGEQRSLADEAVTTLATVAAMTDGLSLDRPERHAVRELKQSAEEVLFNAFRTARRMAYAAKDLGALVDEVKKEAANG